MCNHIKAAKRKHCLLITCNSIIHLFIYCVSLCVISRAQYIIQNLTPYALWSIHILIENSLPTITFDKWQFLFNECRLIYILWILIMQLWILKLTWVFEKKCFANEEILIAAHLFKGNHNKNKSTFVFQLIK